MKKRILPLLLAVLFLLGAVPFAASAETATAKISGIDTSRGEGSLIVYTPGYGATTATNEWGVEAVVGADNKVISVGGNNSEIPKGGFVVSGHDSDVAEGKNKTWVKNNIHVGDYVYYNDITMLLTVSAEPLDMDKEFFFEITHAVNGVNATRGENAMIVFNPSKGATTGTNEYGYEVIVRNGLVTKLGGNNSNIPSDGFVVSGHGTSLDWLQANVIIGMRAEYNRDSKTIKFIYDAEGLEKGISAVLDTIPTAIEKAKNNFMYIQYDVLYSEHDKASKALTDAVAAHKAGGSDAEFAAACDAIKDQIAVINASISESYTVQYRAVWVRPSQSNASEVDAYVKQLHDAGINTVCVEGNFNNGVIMNTPEDCLFQRIKTFRYDVLQAYIDACHKYGMECHLWMAIMEVGHSKGSYYRDCIAYKKPEWLCLNQNGTPDNPDDFMMIDPANEEAREYLVSFYEWIIRNYDIDCFELDYIRYYTQNGTLDFGYTQTAFDGFEEAYGHGVTPTFDTNASYWNDWVKYRQDCVTEMVKAVYEMVERVAPEVLISADVVASPNGGATYSYQNYLPWLEEGWIDILHPMAYGDGFGDDIKQQVSIGGDRCMIVTGLGVFMPSLGATEMVRQAAEDNEYGAYGDCYFEASAYLKDKAGEALLQSVYRNDALAPFLDRDASIKACLNYLKGHIDDVLLPFDGVSEDEATVLKAAIDDAVANTADSRIAPAQLSALRDAIDAVANTKARKALNADLLRAERIIITTYQVSRDELVGDISMPEGDRVFPPETSEDEVSEEESKTESAAVSEDASEPTGTGKNPVGGVVLYILLGILGAGVIAVAIILVLKKKK